MHASLEPIVELRGLNAGALDPLLLSSSEPRVLRGLVAHWPMVQAGANSAADAVAYLKRFARAEPVVATVAAPESGGRFFYTDDVQGFNFRQERVPLPVVLDTLLRYLEEDTPPAIYVGSTSIDTWLPGFRAENDLGLGGYDPLASIWIGNRTRIAAHQDVPDNIACVVAGRRRVTLFPPEQLENLYIGPLDRTPAGQAVSMVDFANPDLQRFPRFAEALRHARVVELEPGDAILIPSMWWHHMEAQAEFNILVNYWWRQSPAYMDSPMNALMLGMLSIRDLPPAQRQIWQDVFRHYVFEADDSTAAHLPDAARGLLAPMDETRELRARLLQRMNR